MNKLNHLDKLTEQDLTPDEIVAELTMLINDELTTLNTYLNFIMNHVPANTEGARLLAAKLTSASCILNTVDLMHLLVEAEALVPTLAEIAASH